MQVEQFLENSAGQYPDKVALISGDERLTYRQIEERANQLAHALIAAGVKRGDRVVTFLPNSMEAVLAVFATLKAGAVFVVLNPTTKDDKLTYILNNCRASAMVTRGGRFSSEPDSWTDRPHLRSVFMLGASEGQSASLQAAGKKMIPLEQLGQEAIQPPTKKCIDIDLAALIYTSGSTGRPKGVMVTHLNIVSAATSITTYLENTADDVVINTLPLAFDYGLYQLLMTFKVGGTLVLHDSFAFPTVVIQKIIQEGVTGFPIVPTVSALLLQMDLSKYKFPKLRYITNTAAALPVEHIRKLRALFPEVKLYSMYGLTECKRVSYLSPEQLDVRPSSVGKGMPNEEVYVVDESGNRVAPGVVGELVIRGSNVMKGYWELPEETNRCLKPGPLPGEKALYSGDLFREDEEGYLYFVGRKDDIIKTRGEKVSPREVEDVIYALEGVAEVAVIGVPDAILGSAIKAVLTLHPGAQITKQDVLRHCSAKLEDFMRPKIVEFREWLPKTESGKISKRMIADEHQETPDVATIA
ncbi:MAG TPA: AMP-binding protein [Candidatus Acidoferrum sp.]|nr:AMP-binding protein [Candidatus Acidoferrum sp.]